MAELALNIFDPGMNPVAERYGLLRANVGGVLIKKVKKEHRSKYRQKGQKQGPPVPLYGG